MRVRSLAAAAALLLATAPTWAQSKVATVDMPKIVAGVAEIKDINAANKTEGDAFNAEVQKRVQAIKDIESQRDQIKPESPQYLKLTQDMNKAKADLQVWGQTSQQDRQRRVIDTAKRLHDHITAAIKDVAEKRGIDLVLSDQKVDLPPDQMDKMNAQQIMAVTFGHNIFYASDKVDLTQEVIATLDAKYKGK